MSDQVQFVKYLNDQNLYHTVCVHIFKGYNFCRFCSCLVVCEILSLRLVIITISSMLYNRYKLSEKLLILKTTKILKVMWNTLKICTRKVPFILYVKLHTSQILCNFCLHPCLVTIFFLYHSLLFSK